MTILAASLVSGIGRFRTAGIRLSAFIAIEAPKAAQSAGSIKLFFTSLLSSKRTLAARFALSMVPYFGCTPVMAA